MRKRTKKQTTQRLAKTSPSTKEKIPLIEHIHELRRRLFYVAACVAVGSSIAYGLEHQIIALLLRPSHGQNFIYTSPLGGINFLFGICLDIGLVLATPVIIYQLLAFLRPLMRDTTRGFLLLASGGAFFVALLGVVFGYFVGLPSALHFLLHQFTTVQVRPLLTIQSYVSFVSLYLFGSALMFQLPLIMLIINRIKPLKPSGLFKYERHLIVAAFIVAFIMNPTPNLVDQMLVVVPIIIMYQLSIAMVWFVNRHLKPSAAVESLREQDAQRRAERASRHLSPLMVSTALPAAPALAAVPVSPLAAPVTLVQRGTPTVSVVSTQTVAAILAVPQTPTVDTAPLRSSSLVNPQRRNYMPLRGQLVQ